MYWVVPRNADNDEISDGQHQLPRTLANSERTKPKKAPANDLFEISNIEWQTRIWRIYASCANEIGIVDFLHHVEVDSVHAL